jgi:hypothetical protein
MSECSNPICQELFGNNENLLSNEYVDLYKVSSAGSCPCTHNVGDAQVQLIYHESSTNKLCNIWISTNPGFRKGPASRHIAYISLDLMAKSVQLTIGTPAEISPIEGNEVFSIIITILSKVTSIPEWQVLDYLDTGLHHYLLRSPRPSPESLQLLVKKCLEETK